MKIGIIGAGRIGKVHIRNISLFVPGMEIKTVADPFANEETAAYAKQFGIQNVTKEAADILNDPEIEAGDVDTAAVTVKFRAGTIATIDNSRKAVYGYDQRVEVFGSKGVAMNGNDVPNTATFADAAGTVGGTAFQVMWDRYERAFVEEMKAFADAVENDVETPVTGMDGLYPVLMAAAATKSLKEGRPVKISEVE